MAIRLCDNGILIRKRQLGETKHILTFFTKDHGQIKGAGRISKKNHLDLGAVCAVNWSARLEDQLGFVDVESFYSPTRFLFGDYTKLLALQSMLQLLEASLVDRHPYPKLYEATYDFLTNNPAQDNKEEQLWQALYVQFELMYLEELGFGLDLSRCALTGSRDDLYYLSPHTGRASTKEAGTLYKEKLFVIPKLFLNASPCTNDTNSSQDFAHALSITGHFIKKHLFHGNLPMARDTLDNEINKKMKAA